MDLRSKLQSHPDCSAGYGRRERHPRRMPRGTGGGPWKGLGGVSALKYFIFLGLVLMWGFFLFGWGFFPPAFSPLPKYAFPSGCKTLPKTNEAGIYSGRQILFLGGYLRKWSCRNCFLDLLFAAREEKSGDRTMCCSDVKPNGPWLKGL